MDIISKIILISFTKGILVGIGLETAIGIIVYLIKTRKEK